ncbi:MAG: MerR family transcriptional regulator [Rhodobacteraceae bacterium]|nr:MerR family transcriptional regulator [Paracoccaceae bacterium]
MEKSAEAFRTISEVSDLLNTPAHVLRFWESRFSQIKPVKRAGGRRYYRPADLALLGGVKKLLHEDGLTIRGVQKILKEQGIRHVAALSPDLLPADEPTEKIVAEKANGNDRGAEVAPPPAPVRQEARDDPAPAAAPQPEPAAPRAATPVSDRQPAAAMLRAMDALRAQEKKSELTSVYLRLVDLKERMARNGAATGR